MLLHNMDASWMNPEGKMVDHNVMYLCQQDLTCVTLVERRLKKMA